MPITTTEDLIHKAYSSLSERELLVADLILQSPKDICMYSASELANMAGVSNSTITRFVQRIGFTNYEEMRRKVRESSHIGSPLTLDTQVISVQLDPGKDRLNHFVGQENEILRTTFAELSSEKIDEITTALTNARNLGFMGFRNSYYFAAYARWQFIQFREKTRMIPGPGETVAERIADLGKGDLVLVVGVRRVVGILERYLEAISNTGADVLLITDPSARVIPAFARWTITCPVENLHAFDCYGGVLAVIRLLVYETFHKTGNLGRQYMEKIEAWHDELAEFE